MYPVRGGEGVRSEGGLTEFILEKMIAKGMTIMSNASKKTIAKKMTITKFAAVSTRRPPSEPPKILNNPRNRISKSTMSRIFHTVRGVQCVSRLADERTCTAKCWIKETNRQFQ